MISVKWPQTKLVPDSLILKLNVNTVTNTPFQNILFNITVTPLNFLLTGKRFCTQERQNLVADKRFDAKKC